MISKRELWGTAPKQPLERNHAAKESSALQTLHWKLKEINSEKLTAVYFALYEGFFFGRITFGEKVSESVLLEACCFPTDQGLFEEVFPP